MKYKKLVLCCTALVILVVSSACSKELNVAVKNDSVVEYGAEIDSTALFDPQKSDQDIIVEKIQNFDAKKIGKQELSVIFSKDNQQIEKQITIEVKDTQKPVIKLAEDTIVISQGEDFDFASLVKEVSDPVDGELKLGKENEKGTYWIDTSQVDEGTAGEYKVSVHAMDRNGLTAESVSVKVTVEAKEAAVSEQNGQANGVEESILPQNSGNSANTSNSVHGNRPSGGSSSENASSNQGSSESRPSEPTKGPKPAKYTVILANDFPNDFPKDGWSWRYSTYVWTPKSTSWVGDELVSVEWEVALRSTTNDTSISLAPQTIANVKKYMVPAPTLEESKKLIKPGDDYFYIRYGAVNVYVCMES